MIADNRGLAARSVKRAAGSEGRLKVLRLTFHLDGAVRPLLVKGSVPTVHFEMADRLKDVVVPLVADAASLFVRASACVTSSVNRNLGRLPASWNSFRTGKQWMFCAADPPLTCGESPVLCGLGSMPPSDILRRAQISRVCARSRHHLMNAGRNNIF
ncbi:hypothetical protein [Roseateles amylovorans]|uniref:Uncharacterized protein n=1 Tax=Roseateles amylovorans TaxID=2978473 RepID=A0ABY6B5M8_9BURK|nr:hypothetical protein [Roseateles amylovorans]UXH79250.1 hypothetical protein N4261_04765 [Roseateles amylovorans]